MGLQRSLGPLDKRKKVKRCQACARRRIKVSQETPTSTTEADRSLKCTGGMPCEYCTRTHKECRPQSQLPLAAVFVSQTSESIAPMDYGTLQVRPMDMDIESRCLDCFIMFAGQNQFTSQFQSVGIDLLPVTQRSPSLRYAAIAIGALDASRRGSARSHQEEKSLLTIAFNAYSKSINALQRVLTTGDVALQDDVLWSTFLLGLFELISNSSGDGWAKHMLYGAGRLLQLAGPNRPVSSLRWRFWELFRGLEALRAILYGEHTMLSQNIWVTFQQDLSASKSGSWDPMESILALMIHTSEFSKRFFDLLGGVSESYRATDGSIDDLGIQGLEIQTAIYEWHTEALGRLADLDGDSQFQLALAYYHGLLLFLSSNYRYYPHWDAKPAPVLSQAEADGHVNAILHLAEQILDTSNIPGVMLFFPLRVAGSQALYAPQRSNILGLLGQVHRKGFMVSDQIYADLVGLWEYQKSIYHS
ncbi:fungal-specific transcription factor domain-containing protein [Talaromyces proteolyticus]|uniref:Fungal-specific transcription factor domain-containing protein n=1 Tax=Talaromyces proteolyticus TaxID=1131652 RepID=A0AAD4KUJ8_9EURO|nr:fungal-specific transcription factor domain-containing protein [Talaromyces proteolyticus]KAH8697086.1 fungal-specific transcription factor domain-containing protein [Talaromyces proteolyticus]